MPPVAGPAQAGDFPNNGVLWQAHGGEPHACSLHLTPAHRQHRDRGAPDDIATDLWPADTGGAIVAGGETRTASVRAGLAALAGRVDHVLIHDVARPLISHAVIDRVIAALEK